jgi:acetyltransferase-like isoleucine patch superfamily enzyme
MSNLIKVGEFTYGHEAIQLMSWGEGTSVNIGKFCSIAQEVRIFLGGNHNSDWISTYPFGHINQAIFGEHRNEGHPSTKGDVSIGNDVWIGFGATIMSGVSIGSGAIIAANSHVVKDVPEYEIWGGNPARFIKHRFESAVTEKLLRLNWWDYPVNKILKIKDLLSSELSIDSLEKLEKILKD